MLACSSTWATGLRASSTDRVSSSSVQAPISLVQTDAQAAVGPGARAHPLPQLPCQPSLTFAQQQMQRLPPPWSQPIALLPWRSPQCWQVELLVLRLLAQLAAQVLLLPLHQQLQLLLQLQLRLRLFLAQALTCRATSRGRCRCHLRGRLLLPPQQLQRLPLRLRLPLPAPARCQASA